MHEDRHGAFVGNVRGGSPAVDEAADGEEGQGSTRPWQEDAEGRQEGAGAF